MGICCNVVPMTGEMPSSESVPCHCATVQQMRHVIVPRDIACESFAAPENLTVLALTCNSPYSKVLWSTDGLKLQQLLKQQQPANDSLAPLPAIFSGISGTVFCECSSK